MGAREAVKLWADGLASVIMPRLCEVCGAPLVQGEEVICLDCDCSLPRCNIHNDSFNTLHQRLAGNVPVDRAAAYFYYYRSTPFTRLIQAAKYDGRPCIGRVMARRFARELTPDGFFDGIDAIVPVPLHWLKRLRRGYNQSLHVALGLQDMTGIPVADNLRARAHATQTRRGPWHRWINARGIYSAVRPGELEGRHLLVVDDVITSGATMLACCEALHKAAPGARISVLALGVTSLA